MKKKVLSTVAFMTFLLQLSAQVTIGSLIDPNEGALLDLKEDANPGINSTQGVLLPRVGLITLDRLYPMFAQGDVNYTGTQKEIHTGLVVYNLTTDFAKGLCPGPYIWDGKQWIRSWEDCKEPILNVICPSTMPVVNGKIGIAINAQVSIPYTVTGAPYSATGGSVGNINGVTATIPNPLVLPVGSGNITVTISGTPTKTGFMTLPVTIDGHSCNIQLDIINNVINPSTCPDSPGYALVAYASPTEWYVLGVGELTGTNGIRYEVAEAFGPFATEDEALRDPRAHQMCSSVTQFRCVQIFNRAGKLQYRYTFNSISVDFLNNILTNNTASCAATIHMSPGNPIQVHNPNNESQIYAVGILIRNSRKYLGAVSSGGLRLTTNSLK
jgi:hypothetical protein